MKKVKILYVEDELHLGQIVSETLKSRSYQVNMVSDGALVLDQFISFKPDICILDIMLPNKDGYTIGKEITALNTGTPIIFLSAKTQAESVLKGFESGGRDYIRKPFSIEELIVRIENILKIPQKEKKDPLHHKFGSYHFSMMNFELKGKETTIQLSYKEAQLLNILLEHKNQKIDRDKILNAIWGTDSFINSRTLDVYVNKLRKLLKGDEQVNIKTLKGIGYIFIVY
ncbi:MAG: DNA-binding response OmpR family regulator [Maribacter sp.]|jgi:DNA-binding response OmpR family regulator